MKCFLYGYGVEDSRSPAWGHVYASLVRAGHTVFAFDPAEPARLATNGAPETQLPWLLTNRRSDVFLLLSDAGDDRRLIDDAAAETGAEVIELRVPELSNTPATDGALCNIALLQSTATPANEFAGCDVLIVGDCSPERHELLMQLSNADRSIRTYGHGWDAFDSLRHRNRSPVGYAYMASALRSATVVLALTEPEPATLETGPIHLALGAAAAGVPVISVTGTGVSAYFDAASDEVVIVDTSEIESAVAQLLGDAELRARISANAARRVSSYDWANRWPQLLGEAEPDVRVTHDGPKVSFMTAAYKAETYIGRALDSMLGQSLNDIEVLVMDDGSPDGSAAEVRKRASDSRVRLVSQANAGQMGRFDWIFGGLLPHARGEYIALIGGDDVAAPSRLERQVSVLEQDPGADIVHTAGRIIDKTGKDMGPAFRLVQSYNSHSMFRLLFNGGSSIADPTVMVRRSLFDRVGSWNGGFASEYNLWFKSSRVTRFRFLPDELTYYRIHDSNASIGAGAEAGIAQLHVTARPELDHSTMVDLYPSLAHINESDNRAWAAAHVDLGNILLSSVALADLALRHYERALMYAGLEFPAINVNKALALVALDERQRAADVLAIAAAAGVKHAPSTVEQLTVDMLVSGDRLSSTPFVLAGDNITDAISWDGTRSSQSRILLIPDWSNMAAVERFVSAYLETFRPDDDVDLVLPLLGIQPNVGIGELVSILPASIDLEQSAALTLEEWTSIDSAPPGRFAFALDARTYVEKPAMDRAIETLRALRKSLTRS